MGLRFAAMSEDHSADRTRLLALVPADGTAVGSTALIRQLGWAENRYWYARDSLLEAGVSSAREAAAASVRRAHPDEGAAPEVSPEAEFIGEAALAYLHEHDLYPDIKGRSRRSGPRNARSSRWPSRSPHPRAARPPVAGGPGPTWSASQSGPAGTCPASTWKSSPSRSSPPMRSP